MAAEQLAGQHVVHVCPGCCGSSGDLLQLLLHCVKQLLRYNGRDPALDPDVLPDIHACIPLVPEYGVQAIFIPPGTPGRSEPSAVQRRDDLGDVRAGRVHLEDLPDDGRAGRFDRILAVLTLLQTEREAAVVYLAGQSVVVHTSADVLGEVRAVILGRALEHRLQQDPLRAVRDRLHDAIHFDAVLLQPGFIHGRVVPVPGEAVDLIHEHPLPASLRGVFDHPQELRPLIRRAADRVVAILGDDLDVVLPSPLTADPELLLNAGVLLGVAGVPGVYDRPDHVFAPCFSSSSKAAAIRAWRPFTSRSS